MNRVYLPDPFSWLYYHVLEMLYLEMARLKIEYYQSLNCEKQIINLFALEEHAPHQQAGPQANPQ